MFSITTLRHGYLHSGRWKVFKGGSFINSPKSLADWAWNYFCYQHWYWCHYYSDLK